MMYTVGSRLKERHAKQLRMEWSSEWAHTNYYDTEEEAEEKKREWERNKRNDATEFKIIPVEKVTHVGDGEVYIEVQLEEETTNL